MLLEIQVGGGVEKRAHPRGGGGGERGEGNADFFWNNPLGMCPLLFKSIKLHLTALKSAISFFTFFTSAETK